MIGGFFIADTRHKKKYGTSENRGKTRKNAGKLYKNKYINLLEKRAGAL